MFAHGILKAGGGNIARQIIVPAIIPATPNPECCARSIPVPGTALEETSSQYDYKRAGCRSSII